jgi:hypothetical protein
LHDRAPGYGIARLSKRAQSITMECWPRYVDPRGPDAVQYEGWPLTVSMDDNYGREALAFLPTLEFSGMEYPVVQVIDESDDQIVYTVRAKGNRLRPKVFSDGTFTIRVGEPGTEKMQILRNIKPETQGNETTLLLEF